MTNVVVLIYRGMREDRCAMIQSYEQLQFTYKCLARFARKMGLLQNIYDDMEDHPVLKDAIAKSER